MVKERGQSERHEIRKLNEIIISFLLNLGLLANIWSLIRKNIYIDLHRCFRSVGKLVYLFYVIMLSFQYVMYRCCKLNGVAELVLLANCTPC